MLLFLPPPPPHFKKQFTEEIDCFSIYIQNHPKQTCWSREMAENISLCAKGVVSPCMCVANSGGQGYIRRLMIYGIPELLPLNQTLAVAQFLSVSYSVQFRMVSVHSEKPVCTYALHPSSWKSPQRCLWKGANAWVIDNVGPPLSFQGRSSVFSDP